jgi:DNA-binding FadR family transcriptional regulator
MTSSSYDLAAKLARMIDDGAWLQGQRLPPERDLAEQFGMARNTVRRALKSLEDGGVLIRQVGRGTFVRPASPHRLGRLSSQIEQSSPAEIMEVRLIFEPQAALIAAGRAAPEDLRAIEQAFRNSVAAKGAAEFEEWDARFHLSIIRATRNTMLIDYCEAINAARQQPQWHRLKQRSTTPESRSLYDRQHGAIVAALRDRDADAARAALQRHLTDVRDRLLGL